MIRRMQSAKEKSPLRKRRPNSLKIAAAGFLGVILVGALLLMLPVCNADGHFLNFIDALFTACTCVCVTGLVTVVPAVQFTLPGKAVMLVLIQIGGWGVIVCVMALLVLLKKRISISERALIHDNFGSNSLSGVVRLLLYVVKGSLLVEGIGALGYACQFVPQYGFVRGLWYSVFHAVSAFCNAGIDLLGDTSLAAYVTNPWMNFVTAFLIISGGLGFVVWKDLSAFFKNWFGKHRDLTRCLRSFSLHSKLVLTVTAALLLIGTLFFFFVEYDNPQGLGPLSVGQKLLAAFFQSVTTRTAGFYTIPQVSLRQVSKFFGCLLMFVGGSPMSTAGGIKTVTAAVLLLTCWSILRGRSDTEVFRRQIAASSIRIALTVFAMSFLCVLSGVILVSLQEPEIPFIDVLYEVVSAVATVGLSADVTPSLHTDSKCVIIFLMYAGRIGPVTLPTLLAKRLKNRGGKWTLPEEHIIVG